MTITPKLFAGFDPTTNQIATVGPHLLVLAATGTGKSRRALVPQICLWDGPVLAVSAKSDLAEMSGAIRAHRRGPMYVMDLTGQADWSEIPPHATPVISDPCALLVPDADGNTDDSAFKLATLLTEVGTLGMGGSSGGGGGDSAFWMTLALRSLAALLQAGGWYRDPVTEHWVWGGGIEWVVEASSNMGPDVGPEEDVHLQTPDWTTAGLRCATIDSFHGPELASVKAVDPRQRDSVGINMRVALSSWHLRSVRHGRQGAEPFTPEMLEDPSATLYLISPSSGSAAGAATSVIESVVEHWKLHSIVKGLPKLSMVIDECPQICPIPRLGEHIGVMRGYGVHFTVAAQHSHQFHRRWGRDGTQELRNVFPAIMVGLGAIERDILEQAHWTMPQTERASGSMDSSGRGTISTDRVAATTPGELLPRHMGEARLIEHGMPSRMVRLMDYTELLQ